MLQNWLKLEPTIDAALDATVLLLWPKLKFCALEILIFYFDIKKKIVPKIEQNVYIIKSNIF